MKTRREILQAALATTLPGISGAVASAAEAATKGRKRMLYIGTYAGVNQPGVYQVDLDEETGQMKVVGSVSGVENPSFVAIHPNKKFLYSVCETSGGQVAAFAIDGKTGGLTLLNKEPSKGDGPCHVGVDKEGKCVTVANYGSGSVACLPIGKDGRVGPAAWSEQFSGTGPNASRQEGPHAHSVTIDATNRYAVAADLGTDKLHIYHLDPAKATLTPSSPPFVATQPGAGPRHFAFHPDGKHAYAINEMGNTIAVYDWDAEKGTLTERQIVGTLPAGYTGESTTAEVRVHPSGKFVYGSNRGHDSIAAFAVDAKTGQLTAIGHTPTGGKTPRNFNLTPSGALLIAANQNSDSLAAFRVDGKTGKLTPVGQPLTVPKPVCIRYL